jgi:5-formaminoimidazole-4-carboxamide-1-(beta)-D-ribofuranosyl 5'-monophosphate synthetase
VRHPDLEKTLAAYDRERLTLCSIGSHSALEVAAGARAQGLRNLIVTERGRERTYAEHYIQKSDPPRGCVDATLPLEKFTDILDDAVQEQLLAANVLFIANRSFEVYLRQKFTYAEMEARMRVPFFGSRTLLRAEERDEADNQYSLLERALSEAIRPSARYRSHGDGEGAARKSFV